jgi:hypothetical protein
MIVALVGLLLELEAPCPLGSVPLLFGLEDFCSSRSLDDSNSLKRLAGESLRWFDALSAIDQGASHCLVWK